MATKSLREYMDEYGEGHRHFGTRLTHMFGIPMIVAALPIFPFNPLMAGGMFVGGWVLQFIGHYVFEKNDPKFFGDPVNLLIGVVWAAKEWAELVGVKAAAPVCMIHRYSVEVSGSEREISVEKLDGNRVRITRDGNARVYEAVRVAKNARASTWSLLPEGGGRQALVDVDGVAPDLTVTVDNKSVPCKLTSARAKVAGRAAPPPKTGPSAVLSPMPGKVVKVLVAVGDEVKSGQGVVVVEAMKMENELKAPKDGKIKAVAVKEGQPVEAGQSLVTLE